MDACFACLHIVTHWQLTLFSTILWRNQLVLKFRKINWFTKKSFNQLWSYTHMYCNSLTTNIIFHHSLEKSTSFTILDIQPGLIFFSFNQLSGVSYVHMYIYRYKHIATLWQIILFSIIPWENQLVLEF